MNTPIESGDLALGNPGVGLLTTGGADPTLVRTWWLSDYDGAVIASQARPTRPVTGGPAAPPPAMAS